MSGDGAVAEFCCMLWDYLSIWKCDSYRDATLDTEEIRNTENKSEKLNQAGSQSDGQGAPVVNSECTYFISKVNEDLRTIQKVIC